MKPYLLPSNLRESYYKNRKESFLAKNKECKQIVQFRGCKFFAGSANKLEAALLDPNGRYDWDNFTAIEQFVNKGDVCFDIGANIGIYSVILSRLSGSDKNIHSFEPVNHIRSRLTANCKLNGFYDVNINDFALGDKRTKAEMYQVKDGVFRGGTSTFKRNENYEKLGSDKFDLCDVEIYTLDDYFIESKLDRVNFLKIDVEGFEWQVLLGAKQTLAKYSPTILMEYDPLRHFEIEGSNNFKSFFADNGYQVFEFKAFDDEVGLVPFDFDRNPVQRNLICFNSSVPKNC